MSSGFVTEAEIEAKKKAKQDEWERVRKPEDPQEAPEEPVDNRSLFDRLEENRVKKQEGRYRHFKDLKVIPDEIVITFQLGMKSTS